VIYLLNALTRFAVNIAF